MQPESRTTTLGKHLNIPFGLFRKEHRLLGVGLTTPPGRPEAYSLASQLDSRKQNKSSTYTLSTKLRLWIGAGTLDLAHSSVCFSFFHVIILKSTQELKREKSVLWKRRLTEDQGLSDMGGCHDPGSAWKLSWILFVSGSQRHLWGLSRGISFQ